MGRIAATAITVVQKSVAIHRQLPRRIRAGGSNAPSMVVS